MFNNKSSKRALVMSVLSLVLCVSMFVGTTFAWFTDSVTSTNNIIKSGSLDVEMLWSDTVDGTYRDAEDAAYPIFNYQYWEPGYTEIKYIKIKNAGDLAFQFQLNIIPDNLPAEGKANLADVIDVYLLPAAAVTRANVDAATPVGTLSELIADRDGAAHGILLPTDGSDRYNNIDAPVGEIAYCIALKMQESAGNEYQNLSVGDGFSLQLLATQYTWEKDSFDHNYDEDAMFPPKADVKCTGPKMIPLMGVGDVVANDTLQFLPKNNYEEAQKNSYRFWHADFVVYADEVIPANSVTLAGFYTAYCGVNGPWIGMSSDQDIPANTPIRLVDLLGVTVNFEEICKWSDGEGFQCGVIDNSNGALAGTTLTVELRLYETTKDPDATSGTANEEVDPENYIVIEDYKYTFGAGTLVGNLNQLQAALNNPDVEVVQLAGDIDAGSTNLVVNRDVAIDLNGHILAGTCNAGSSSLITVKNGATLDVIDNSADKDGKITYAQGTSNVGWTIFLEGGLNLYSGTLELTGDWSIGYAVDARPNAWGSNFAEGTVFHMYGGKIVSSDGAVRVASTSYDSYANISSSFIMDGGEINAAWDGIFVQQSNAAYDTLNVEINGGKIVSALSPIRVYAPAATSVNSGAAKPITITINGGDLAVNGTPDASRVWHTMGKIVLGGGITLDQLNQYATITIA